MKRVLSVFAMFFLLVPGIAAAEDCLLCGKDSTDKCDGAEQCRGTREHCKEIGCKISGTASCSTAANVKICSNALADLAPQMSVVVYQTRL